MNRLFLLLIIFTLLLSGASAAWWDTDWENKTPINNLVIPENMDVNDVVLLKNVDFSALTIACVDLNDLRVVNENNLEELQRQAYGTAGNTDGNIFFQLRNDLAAGTYDGNFYLYSNNNTGCGSLTNPYYLLEDFNDTSNLSTSTAGGTATLIEDPDRNGSVAKLVSDETGNGDFVQFVTNETFTDWNVGFWFKTENAEADKGVSFLVNTVTVKAGGANFFLELLGDGQNFTLASFESDVWYYLIMERNDSSHISAYLFDANGHEHGSISNKAVAAGTTWGTSATASVRTYDIDTATSFYDSIQLGVIGFPTTVLPTVFELGSEEIRGFDVNAWKIKGLPFSSPLIVISSLQDGNVTIDFNVSEPENRRLTIDINYSTTTTQSSGEIIVKDLNLDLGHCNSIDWNAAPVTCSVDWNFSDVADENYFINIFLKNGRITGDANIFKASENSVRVSSDVNLLIKVPINEEDNVVLDMNSYEFVVKVLQNNVLRIFSEQRDDNTFQILIGTANPVIVTIDTNAPTVWQSRSYAFSFDATQISDTLQPYLPPVATSILTTVSTLTSTNLNPLIGFGIRVFKFLPGGRTLVHESLTDGKGETAIPFVIADEYEIDVFDASGTFLSTRNYTATSTSNTLFFYISDEELVEFPEIPAVTVNFRPSIKSHNTTDVNVIVDINSITSSIAAIQVIMINNDVNIFDSGMDTSAPADGNQYVFIIREFTSIDNNFPVNFTVIIRLTDGTELRFNEDSYWFDRPIATGMVSLLVFGMRTDFGCSTDTRTNCVPLMIIAFFIIIIVAGGLAFEGFRNSMGLIIFILAFTAVFVYLFWIPLWIYIMMLITGVAGLVLRARLE